MRELLTTKTPLPQHNIEPKHILFSGFLLLLPQYKHIKMPQSWLTLTIVEYSP